jgi:competence protein ComGC
MPETKREYGAFSWGFTAVVVFLVLIVVTVLVLLAVLALIGFTVG